MATTFFFPTTLIRLAQTTWLSSDKPYINTLITNTDSITNPTYIKNFFYAFLQTRNIPALTKSRSFPIQSNFTALPFI